MLPLGLFTRRSTLSCLVVRSKLLMWLALRFVGCFAHSCCSSATCRVMSSSETSSCCVLLHRRGRKHGLLFCGATAESDESAEGRLLALFTFSCSLWCRMCWLRFFVNTLYNTKKLVYFKFYNDELGDGISAFCEYVSILFQ